MVGRVKRVVQRLSMWHSDLRAPCACHPLPAGTVRMSSACADSSFASRRPGWGIWPRIDGSKRRNGAGSFYA